MTRIVIPIHADVECTDGLGGQSTYAIVNPATWQVTHFVVREKRFPHSERLLPVDWIVETTPESIRVRRTRDELAVLKPFLQIEYVQVERPGGDEFPVEMLWIGNAPMMKEWVPVEHEYVPQGEQVIHQGAHVEASDGYVGRIEDYLMDPTTGRIAGLVLRRGHLWNQKEVAIPVSQISHIEENAIHLKLDESAVESLPAVPVRHRYAWTNDTDVDLVMLALDEQRAADEALKVLKQLKNEAISVYHIAKIVKGQSGLASLEKAEALDAKYDALFADIIAGLVELCSSDAAEVHSASAGLPAQKRMNVRGTLQSRNTIVVALIDDRWTAWVIEVLGEFDGQLTRQHVSDALIAQLMAVAEMAEPKRTAY